VTRDDGYLLDNRRPEAGRRFSAIGALFDEATHRRLLALGLGPGWRVWEVGAGGPGIASRLARDVGPRGRVLATDIDLTWLEGADNFEVRRHDVGTDPPPPGPFDLVHTRLVLVHVPGRVEALASMVEVLSPGGWLVIEEADPALQPLACLEESGPAQRRANELRRGFRELMAGRGVDLAFGRTLPRLLREVGLVEVAAEVAFPVGGPACDDLERATVEQIGSQLVDAGLASEEEIAEHLASVASGNLDLTTAPLVTAWGRRP
jgi:SAM-dependent methyltransferase